MTPRRRAQHAPRRAAHAASAQQAGAGPEGGSCLQRLQKRAARASCAGPLAYAPRSRRSSTAGRTRRAAARAQAGAKAAAGVGSFGLQSARQPLEQTAAKGQGEPRRAPPKPRNLADHLNDVRAHLGVQRGGVQKKRAAVHVKPRPLTVPQSPCFSKRRRRPANDGGKPDLVPPRQRTSSAGASVAVAGAASLSRSPDAAHLAEPARRAAQRRGVRRQDQEAASGRGWRRVCGWASLWRRPSAAIAPDTHDGRRRPGLNLPAGRHQRVSLRLLRGTTGWASRGPACLRRRRSTARSCRRRTTRRTT